MVAGRIVDRVGRKRLLVGALVGYAFVGTAPLWLPSLQLIVASRVLLGLAEAAIMTCCTAARRLLPRLAAGALLRPAGRLHDRRRHALLRPRWCPRGAGLADAVLALRRKPAVGPPRREV